MNQTILYSLATTGFMIAFLHAALPTHWLPFVLAGRAQKWSRPKTLAITLVAGGGHVLFTTILGVLVVWLGIETSRLTGNLFPFIAGGVLIAFGLYYVVRQLRGDGHGHQHFGASHHHDYDQDHRHDHPHDHEHGHNHDHQHPNHHEPQTLAPSDTRTDLAVIGGLIAMLTFSPCEGFLPIYLSGIAYGWWGFVLLSIIFAVATVAGMVLFTWLTMIGLERFSFASLERFENGILGGLLCLLGLGVIILERSA